MTRERLWIAGVLTALVLVIVGVHWKRGTTPSASYFTEDEHGNRTVVKMVDANKWSADKPPLHLDWANTIGIWIGALCTLAVFSFLYRDNPLYRVAEHLFVGISAAYWMTQAFWATLVPNLLGKLFPSAIKFSMAPGLNLDDIVDENLTHSYFSGVIDYAAADGDGLSASWLQLMDPMYIIAAVLGLMLLMRLGPKKGQWMAVMPLAVIIGTTAGLRLIAFSGADFVKQIDQTIEEPLIQPIYEPVAPGQIEQLHFGKSFYESFSNIVLVAGVMCGLIYFFFSLEHKGVVGGAARIGIWILMITFGGGFGFTVMGRVTLLTKRIQELVIDWLNLVEA